MYGHEHYTKAEEWLLDAESLTDERDAAIAVAHVHAELATAAAIQTAALIAYENSEKGAPSSDNNTLIQYR